MKGMIQEFRTRVTPTNGPESLTVDYEVVLDGTSHRLVQGCGLMLRYVGSPRCRHCGASIEPRQGREYCYDCFTGLARCDLCVMSPDRCHFHEGTCREPDWGETFCMQPHTVYLALSHVPKVGITRAGREWYRWADQGAHRALKLIDVPSRRMAGVLEAHLAHSLTDRTDWRKLVMGLRGDYDLLRLARSLQDRLGGFEAFASEQISSDEVVGTRWSDAQEETQLAYPVGEFSPAQKLKLDPEHPDLSDNLNGVIGGYLLLSQGVIAMSTLVRGDVELEVNDGVVLKEKPQMTLF